MTFTENSPQRPRRRRRSDIEPNISSTSPDLVTSSHEENQEQTNFSSVPTTNEKCTEIDEIAAELSQESAYPIKDSDFSDDSHNWYSESEPNSEDYWSFLGRYE